MCLKLSNQWSITNGSCVCSREVEEEPVTEVVDKPVVVTMVVDKAVVVSTVVELVDVEEGCSQVQSKCNDQMSDSDVLPDGEDNLLTEEEMKKIVQSNQRYVEKVTYGVMEDPATVGTKMT